MGGFSLCRCFYLHRPCRAHPPEGYERRYKLSGLRFHSRVSTPTHRLDTEIPTLTFCLCMIMVRPTAFVTGIGNESTSCYVQVASVTGAPSHLDSGSSSVITDRTPHEVPVLHGLRGHALLNLSLIDSDSMLFIAGVGPRALSRHFTSTSLLYSCCPPWGETHILDSTR